MLAPSLCDGVPSHCISPVFAPSVCFGWANPFSTPLVILFLLAPASGSIAAFLPLRHLLSVCTSHTITPSIPPLPFSTAPSGRVQFVSANLPRSDPPGCCSLLFIALFDSLSLSPCCLDPFHRQKALATPSAASICPSVLPPLTLYCSSIPRGVGKSVPCRIMFSTHSPPLPSRIFTTPTSPEICATHPHSRIVNLSIPSVWSSPCDLPRPPARWDQGC